MRLAAIADLSADRAKAALEKTGYPEDRYDATGSMSIEEGVKAGKVAMKAAGFLIQEHGDSAQLPTLP